MDMMIQWITQIIIFLLLATIIDLLIPATTMKKYIKLVVGLILMLIFLKPIFYLFSIDIDQGLESSFSRLYQEATNENSIENLMEMQKTDIQASQGAYISEQVSNELKDLAKAPLLEQHQVEILKIDLLFQTERADTYEDLKEVIVYLRESDQQEGVVSIVDEVIILADDDQVGDEKHDQHDNERIKILLQEVWELNDKDLILKWEGGTS